jgi:hypothetical protein
LEAAVAIVVSAGAMVMAVAAVTVAVVAAMAAAVVSMAAMAAAVAAALMVAAVARGVIQKRMRISRRKLTYWWQGRQRAASQWRRRL